MIKRVDHIAVICSDYQVSRRFYTEILGMTILQEIYRAERDSWKCDLAVNGVYQVELFSFPAPPVRPSRPEACGLRHLAFTVMNMCEAVDRLKSLGVEVEPVRADETRGGKLYTFFADPDGLPLEIVEE